MTKTEYLMTCIIEECSEIQKEVCKGLRFGFDDINPATNETNLTAIKHELNDLLAVVEMIDELKDFKSEGLIIRKQEKLKHWMEYSKEKGLLYDEHK